jgi:hypothetical protein
VRRGTDVMRSDQGLRDYCNGLRRLAGGEFKYLVEGSRELRRALGPHGRMRAWVVAGHLSLAAQAAKAASAHGVAAYLAFLKHFEPELTAARGKQAKKKAPAAGFKFGGR